MLSHVRPQCGDGIELFQGRFPFNKKFGNEISGIPCDEWNSIFRLFRFSGILGQPREVHPKFRNETPENVCSIRSPTRNIRNFWSNGKRPRLFLFSGILGQAREVHLKFRNDIPENMSFPLHPEFPEFLVEWKAPQWALGLSGPGRQGRETLGTRLSRGLTAFICQVRFAFLFCSYRPS